MRNQKKQNNFFIFSQILGVLFSAAFCLFIPRSLAHAAGSQNYIIRLNSPASLVLLKKQGSNIKLLFSQSSDPQFANIYSFDSEQSLASLQKFFHNQYNYIEPNSQIASATVTTNDPYFTNNPQDVNNEWGLAKAGFPQAWNTTIGSPANLVAVIDTGIDETHQDLRSIYFVQGYDFINNEALPTGGDSDDNGHGALVTGILGATPNNGIGIVGTNWYISVMPVKALDASGKGDAATVAEAIVWAADHNAGFINLSFGGIGFGHDVTLANAIAYAFNKGAVIVAAAGNDAAVTGGSLDANPVFPVCDDNNANMVIGVTATDWNDQKPDFANYGKSCVDVTAPGRRIISTINYDPATHNPAPNSYVYAAGTSVAVPFVVGQAALIKAAFPKATNAEIRDRIIDTADPIDSLNLTECGGQSCAGLLGSGKIDVVKSLSAGFEPPIADGDLVKTIDSYVIYQISGGQKRAVSQFVLNQRFASSTVKSVSDQDLAAFPQGPYATPLDGTLIKTASSPTVYQIANGEKLPILNSIFKMWQLNFANVNVLTDDEVNSWIVGNLLTPPEGAIVKIPGQPTLYWVVGLALHPVNKAFYDQRGLSIFPINSISHADIQYMAKGEAYIR